jgi:rhamnosyl/mannosyltransferase
MRILHVYKDYFPVVGGIENHVKALAEAQAAAGHAVTALVCNPGARTIEENINGVRVVKVGRVATVASMPISPGFPRALRAIQPDITHLHYPYPLGEISQWLAGRARPYVITYHADVTRAVQRLVMAAYSPLLLRGILRRAARVMVTSPIYAASSPNLRRIPERITVVPLGVDTERFHPPHIPPAPRPITLLFVGRMRHYKGIDVLLRAMKALPSDVRLVLVGDGPKREAWEALSASLNLHARVAFLGEVPDRSLPSLYRDADVFVLPATTRAEAFGTVIAEAMASGLPCITTEVGTGTSYVVEDGATGFVVPPRSPEALAGALNRLIADPALRARMGAAGRDRALRLFRFDDMIARVEAVYREVVSSSRPLGS